MDNTAIIDPNNELNLTLQEQINTYDKQEKLNVVKHSAKGNLSTYYHITEIQQNTLIVSTAQKIIWAGFVVICVGILFALCGKVDAALITSISGIITEVISGVVFSFVTQSSKSKQQYFKQLAMAEEGDKIIGIIESLDKDAKERLFEKIVDNYCDLRKQVQ